VPTHSARPVSKASSNNLNRQAGLYSLAAAVAGVSMLALAQPAQSEVVITKRTLPLPGLLYLDINNDGINDFAFNNYFSFGSADLAVRGAVPGRGGALVLGPSGYASPLMRGANIGPSARFSPYSSYALVEKGVHVGYSHEKLYGPWGGNPKNRYLGVRFRIDGKIHYGWVRLTMLTQPAGTWSAAITAYAYETIPNKKIVAGSAKSSASDAKGQSASERPSGASLGMLALGADGLPVWRREETSTSK
jgi:hypothetical protein